jgi:hypothetical protein
MDLKYLSNVSKFSFPSSLNENTPYVNAFKFLKIEEHIDEFGQ